jgi:hypothetical protein
MELLGITGDKDAWAFVNVKLDEPNANVLVHVRIGTCRGGLTGKAIASPASIHDKRLHRIQDGPLDGLDARFTDIRTRP